MTSKAPHFENVSPAVHKSMTSNKGKNTKPELLVRKRLREDGLLGYRVHWKVPGHPDVAWPGKKVAIFVHGCFWHRCPHCQLPVPKTNQEYWIPKFERNVERDRENIAKLESDGWRVHVIWECELKKKNVEATFDTLLPELHKELGK
ncbi:very short patch repair endonuclease [Slackia heliotrinireducens]|uniref:Very short patch repair endonuclease n=1 Tax=Slackia heliotrinireducens (strain ATCC 29202 / DSM 20476 / NCTC 11029 / RHS 1) TaxID=471855 RepID=C7N4R6_SLAHD|nr:very short patch repair endonuclease [Slackia heliotrinireducens]ACV21901.1 T/G mismatch-specific endonuclease [Slackia heliotrinireducens DSM 20476]VEG99700.1 Very short patch repair protein [Slackia heliotrinireducens]